MRFGRTLLLLILLTVGCAQQGGVTLTPIAAPLPLPSLPAPTELAPPQFAPLVLCYGGDMMDEMGVYTNDSWLFSSKTCVVEAGLTKDESLVVKASPRLSVAWHTDLTVTVIHHGEGDTLHVGINGTSDYERLSEFPLRGAQSLVEWKDVPQGVYYVWAFVTRKERQVASGNVKVCYTPNPEDC